MSTSQAAILLRQLRQWRRDVVLADGIGKAAVLTHLKTTAAVALLLGVLAAGAGLAVTHFLALKPPEAEIAAIAPQDQPKREKGEHTDLYGDPLPPGALLRLGTVRFRNPESIGQIAYTPDGKLLAAGGFGGSILLYEAATGHIRRRLQAPTFQFPSLAIAPDGKTLASADSRTIQFWDLATGKELRRIDVQAPRRSDYGWMFLVPLVYSHDGKSLAWVAADHAIVLWDAQTGKERVKLSGEQKPIRCVAFSPDDKMLLSASYDRMNRDGAVRVWDVAAGKEARKFALDRRQPAEWPVPLCFSPDCKTLAISSRELPRPNKGAKIFENGYPVTFLDLQTGKVKRKLEPHTGNLKAAHFSADGKTIAALREIPRPSNNYGSEHSYRIQIADAATGKQLVEFPAYADVTSLGVYQLVFSPDGKKLAAAATASSLHVWDVARGREEPERSQTHHDKICCVAFSPDGRTVASGSADHTIALWDAATGKQQRYLRGHGGQVASLAFSPDGKLLASAARLGDQSIRLWDTSSGKELRPFSVPWEEMGNGMSRSVNTWVAFAANGKRLAAGGTDRKVRLWDVATGKELRNQEVRGLPARSRQGKPDWRTDVRDVTLTHDGRVMAMSIGGTVHIADIAAGQRLNLFEKDRDGVPRFALSPDGKTMAYEGLGYLFRLVEIASGQELHVIDLPKNVGVLAMAFAPDGRTIALAIARHQGWIYLFDVPTGKQLLRLQGGASSVQSLAFSPDGTKLASAQNDTTALIWDISATRRAGLRQRPESAGDPERLWTQLRDADAVKAHAALWTLVAAPDQAVPFLKEHLHPVPRVSAERLRRLIADLDADDFTRREEASRSLAKLGSEAEPALRKALEDKPTLELRSRVQALLDNLVCQTAMTPDALRQLRAIQVLEQIGTPQARQIIEKLAQGAPAAPATRDAIAALARLQWHPAMP